MLSECHPRTERIPGSSTMKINILLAAAIVASTPLFVAPANGQQYQSRYFGQIDSPGTGQGISCTDWRGCGGYDGYYSGPQILYVPRPRQPRFCYNANGELVRVDGKRDSRATQRQEPVDQPDRVETEASCGNSTFRTVSTPRSSSEEPAPSRGTSSTYMKDGILVEDRPDANGVMRTFPVRLGH